MARAGDALWGLYDYWYKPKLAQKHGADRYQWENMPFFGSIHRWKQGAQRAEDSYNRTGVDDYYGDRYGGQLDSLVNSFTSAGRSALRMATNVEDIFPPEFEEDVSTSRYRMPRSIKMWPRNLIGPMPDDDTIDMEEY